MVLTTSSGLVRCDTPMNSPRCALNLSRRGFAICSRFFGGVLRGRVLLPKKSLVRKEQPVMQNTSALPTERRSFQVDGSTIAICKLYLGVAKSFERLPCGGD